MEDKVCFHFSKKMKGVTFFWVSLEMEKTKRQNFPFLLKTPSGNVVIGVSVKLPEERINHSYLSAVPSALNKTKRDRKLYWSIWVAF